MRYQLAHVNVAWMHAAVDDPEMAGFAARIDEINGLAESSSGFIWRIPNSMVDAAALEPFESDFPGFRRDRLLYNMSVWERFEDLYAYTFRSAHAELLNDRHQWIDRIEGASVALWWIPAGNIPTIAESVQRLRSIKEFGATPYAFTLRKSFPAP
jgi:hypothetical protein